LGISRFDERDGMKYSEACAGRVFVMRLEDGDILHEAIEAFALEHRIESAALIALGGADEGSRLVVGPEESRAMPVHPMEYVLDGVHEMAGVGTLFPDASGRPVLHMHIAGGREGKAVAGCVRSGVRVWHVAEVILWEMTHSTGRRLLDPATGFELLVP
jgi:predicted DNA-binding protein with PD1-like motif